MTVQSGQDMDSADSDPVHATQVQGQSIHYQEEQLKSLWQEVRDIVDSQANLYSAFRLSDELPG